MLQRQIEDR